MKASYRAAARLAVVFCVLIGSLAWLAPGISAENGKPVINADDAPTATVTIDQDGETPGETDPLPVVTATDEPVNEPTAASEPLPTATIADVPAGDDVEPAELSSQDATVQMNVGFMVCADTDRLDQTDYIFASGFRGSDTAGPCSTAADAYSPVDTYVDVTLTGDTTYTFTFNNMTSNYFDVLPGTYSVSILSTAGHVISDEMDGTITIGPDDFPRLNIIHYTSDAPEPDPYEGMISLFGSVTDCIDETRAGQADFFIGGIFNANDMQANCVYAMGHGQTSLVLQGEIANGGGTFGPVTMEVNSGGFFDMGDDVFPPGTYTLTDTQTAIESEPFVINSVDAFDHLNFYVDVVRYFPELPAINPIIDVTQFTCENAARAGQTDILLMSQFTPAETCNLVEPASPISLTLTSEDGSVIRTLTLQPVGVSWSGAFTNVPPGSYTLTDDATSATSAPFLAGAGQQYDFQVINYVPLPGGDVDEPVGDGFVYIYGDLQYCTSTDRDGEVDFLIRQLIFATADGDCTVDSNPIGMVDLYKYDDALGTTLLGNWTQPLSYGFSFPNGELTPGYYQLGFRKTSFSTESTLSGIFPVYEGGNVNVQILAYVAPPVAAPVTAVKEYCYLPGRAGETDISLDAETYVDAAATIPCRDATEADGIITFTLTNQDTGESISLEVEDSAAWFGSVPAGTYTMHEDAPGYAATSEPFVVENDVDWYGFRVRNYTDQPIALDETEEEFGLYLQAYNCTNDDRVGDVDLFFSQYTFNFDDFSSAENPLPVQACALPDLGDYAFVLTDDVSGSNAAAAAVYELVEGDPGWFLAPDTIPTGTYVLRETTTGFISDPLVITGNQVNFNFYVYQAAPTPTPSPTPTLTPASSPTSPAAVTPTRDTGYVFPGDGTGQRNPTATPGDGGSDQAGDGAGSVTGVTQLPSTGQGGASGFSTSLSLLLGLALSFLAGAAAMTRRTRRS